MQTMNRRFLVTFAVMAIAWVSVLAQSAVAQERPGPVAELAGGAFMFPDDDGTLREGFVGGAWRFYVSPRVSIGPEATYIRGDRHSHLTLTGNLTFDFTGPVNGQSPSFTPFVVVGGGLFRTHREFPGRGDFTSSEGAFTAGGGVRANLGKRVTGGVEARIGWELHIRVNAVVGVRLGGS